MLRYNLHKTIHRHGTVAGRTLATAAAHTPAQRPKLVEDFQPGADRDKLPMFTLSTERGFLPRVDPLVKLPAAFRPLESLLERMTIRQPDGARGLLALGQFGDAVKHELGPLVEDLTRHVDSVIASQDQRLMSALFRDYCFATSAYLLEPTDQAFRATGDYAPGRPVLPRQLAVPLSKLANALGHFPYMEYSSSYALQNYARIEGRHAGDKLGAMESWDTENLRVIRAFEDADGSEAGFILVHVTMVAETGRIISGAEQVLAAANAENHAAFQAAMTDLLATYRRINAKMDTMWMWSRPADYLKFRSFIFGSGPAKLNSMFPEGVIYEGVSDEPQAFRGESGANDSIIPLADNLLEITAHHPKNELTDTLRDFRSYRPSAQRVYLDQLEKRATEAQVARFARGDEESLGLYALMVDQVREFRDRHWRFTKSYIIEKSSYQLATGGSPIATYLPQNLKTVLTVLGSALDDLGSGASMSGTTREAVENVKHKTATQLRVLDKEVKKIEAGLLEKGSHDRRRWVRGSVGGDGVG